MVTFNLTNFNAQLQSKMLFSVDAMLSPPDIIVNPPYNELFKHLMQVILSRGVSRDSQYTAAAQIACDYNFCLVTGCICISIRLLLKHIASKRIHQC